MKKKKILNQLKRDSKYKRSDSIFAGDPSIENRTGATKTPDQLGKKIVVSKDTSISKFIKFDVKDHKDRFVLGNGDITYVPNEDGSGFIRKKINTTKHRYSTARRVF